MKRRIIFIISLLIGIITTFSCASSMYASGVNKDGGGTWHINTYTAEAKQYPHKVFGLVFEPYEGITYERFYGVADTTECGSQISTLKSLAEAQAHQTLFRTLKLLGPEDYTISMAVSVCHPDWYVVYLSVNVAAGRDQKDFVNASKEVYDKVFEVLQQ